MGFRYTDLNQQTKDASVTLDGGETLHITYRHAYVTVALVADLMTLGNADGKAMDGLPASEQLAVLEAIKRTPQHIVTLVTKWDVTLDDDVMFPLDAGEIAAKLPLTFQMQVLGACVRESRAGEA